MIGLLRNAALNSLEYKQELALVREQNIDITHFEEDLDAFKVAFAKNYNSASTNFGKAIDRNRQGHQTDGRGQEIPNHIRKPTPSSLITSWKMFQLKKLTRKIQL